MSLNASVLYRVSCDSYCMSVESFMTSIVLACIDWIVMRLPLKPLMMMQITPALDILLCRPRKAQARLLWHAGISYYAWHDCVHSISSAQLVDRKLQTVLQVSFTSANCSLVYCAVGPLHVLDHGKSAEAGQRKPCAEDLNFRPKFHSEEIIEACLSTR